MLEGEMELWEYMLMLVYGRSIGDDRYRVKG